LLAAACKWSAASGATVGMSTPVGPLTKSARHGDRPRNSLRKVAGGPISQPPVTLPASGRGRIPAIFGQFRQVHAVALSTRRSESSSRRCLAPHLGRL
jgi:hypothetical protein